MEVTGKMAKITRRRRLAMLGISLCVPAFTAVTVVLGQFVASGKGNAEIVALQSCLAQVKSFGPAVTNSSNQPQAADEKRLQMETYLAGRFRPLITNAIEWNGSMAIAIITPEQRVTAERIVAAHPKDNPAEFALASSAVESQYPSIGPPPQTSFAFAKAFPGSRL